MKLYLLFILLLVACSKPVPPAQPQAAPESPAARAETEAAVPTPDVHGPTTQLESMGAVTMSGVKPHKAHKNGQEAKAYKKAFANALYANALLGRHHFRLGFNDTQARI